MRVFVEHLRVSTHARARRATPLLAQPGADLFRFQPTPAHGGRPPLNLLTKGGIRCFNPRPRTAGDSAHVHFDGFTLAVFQPTPAHGGRREGRFPTKEAAERFQPTPAHGGRQRKACRLH